VVRKLGAIGGLVLLLLLQGCYKTELPAIGYRYGVPVPELHIVHRGDTLIAIGKRYNIGHRKLIRFNHIRPPYTIFVGQRIYLTHAAPRATTHFIPQQHLKRHYKASAKPKKKKRHKVKVKRTPAHHHTTKVIYPPIIKLLLPFPYDGLHLALSPVDLVPVAAACMMALILGLN